MRKTIVTLVLLFAGFLALQSFAQQTTDNSKAGKIWLSQNKLFVTAPQVGILVYNNTDKANPQYEGFIPIGGNVDLAVVDNVLYANHYDELVIIDWEKSIADGQPALLNKVDNVFPNHDSSDKRPFGRPPSQVNVSGQSLGGSMSCFSLDDSENPEFLYAISDKAISTFEISTPANPVRAGKAVATQDVVETVFTSGKNLYLGGPDGMLIYSLSNPRKPSKLGEYKHMTGCDPVVVQGNIAYVTLRSGTRCRQRITLNQLHVVDISNPSSPKALGNASMTNPHGLGTDNGKIFLCDGKAGLKVIDASNPRRIRTLSTTKVPGNAYDVIMAGQRELILVTNTHIVQYRYNTRGLLTKLSEIAVEI